MDDALEFLGRLRTWAVNVKQYIISQRGKEKDLNPLPVARSLEQFSPILAMFVFEPDREDEQPSLSGYILSIYRIYIYIYIYRIYIIYIYRIYIHL